MVKLQPEREITWYTVGCYYYATGLYTTAKKFLSRFINNCSSLFQKNGYGILYFDDRNYTHFILINLILSARDFILYLIFGFPFYFIPKD